LNNTSADATQSPYNVDRLEAVYYRIMSRAILIMGGALQLAVGAPALAQRPTSPTDTIRLSLEEAVSTGLRVADEVRLSQAQADIANAQLDAARAALLPQLRVTRGYTH